jgi:hypothetical protein
MDNTMKVYIGPYKNWIGPYQIADMIFFWVLRYPEDTKLDDRWDYKLHDKFGDWLAGKNNDSWLTRLCYWIQTKRHRKIKVRIDNYDIWGADHTMALVIHPILKLLQESKHGAPMVDDDDVPEELKSTSAPPKKDPWDTDDNHFKRWDYVMEEMIFAFSCKADEQWEDKLLTSLPEIGDNSETSKEKWKLYHEEYAVVQARISNGLRLFGKYYEGLWD